MLNYDLKPFLSDYKLPSNQDREFFGYADVKIFAYFLISCNIVTQSNLGFLKWQLKNELL